MGNETQTVGAGNPGVSVVCLPAYLRSLLLLDKGNRGRRRRGAKGVFLSSINPGGSLCTRTPLCKYIGKKKL